MEAAGPGGKGVDSVAMNRVLVKYLLFQVPGWVGAVAVLWALVRWWELDPRLAVLLFGLWLVKDAVLYPVLRIGYETRGAGADAGLVGTSGVAQDDLGRTYVADRFGGVVEVFRIDGSPVETFGDGSRTGVAFAMPADIVWFTDTSRLYVVDAAVGRVAVFNIRTTTDVTP